MTDQPTVCAVQSFLRKEDWTALTYDQRQKIKLDPPGGFDIVGFPAVIAPMWACGHVGAGALSPDSNRYPCYAPGAGHIPAVMDPSVCLYCGRDMSDFDSDAVAA